MMSPEERRALESIERKVALENEIESRRTEAELEKLEERLHPTAKVHIKNMYAELKDLRVKLPKIVVK